MADERDDNDDPISPSDFGWLFGDDDEDGAEQPQRPSASRDLYEEDEDEDDDLLPPEFLEQDEEPQGFLGRLRRNLAVARGVPEDEFAGADVSAPDPRRRRSAEKGLAATDDPFARLITPLSGPQLEALAEEIRSDELLFGKIRREHRARVRRHTVGLFFAVALLLVFAVTRGHAYIQTTLAHATQPLWLTHALGKSHAGAVLFGLGLVVPLLSINMIAEACSSTLRALFGRSPKALASAVLSGSFSWVVLTLLLDGKPIPATGALVAWAVLRAVISLVSGRGEDS